MKPLAPVMNMTKSNPFSENRMAARNRACRLPSYRLPLPCGLARYDPPASFEFSTAIMERTWRFDENMV
jgi:hypothetical protein